VGWREVRPVGRTDAVTHGNGKNRWIPEESFLVSDEMGISRKIPPEYPL
jgi:hypothetical protein